MEKKEERQFYTVKIKVPKMTRKQWEEFDNEQNNQPSGSKQIHDMHQRFVGYVKDFINKQQPYYS